MWQAVGGGAGHDSDKIKSDKKGLEEEELESLKILRSKDGAKVGDDTVLGYQATWIIACGRREGAQLSEMVAAWVAASVLVEHFHGVNPVLSPLFCPLGLSACACILALHRRLT